MKTWFITGASRGFGRELTVQLLTRGDRVAATARQPEQLDDLAAAYGDQLWRRRLDMTDTEQLRAVVDTAFTELDRIDVVVSNAGYGLFGAAEELTDAQIEHQLATNLTGPIQLARAMMPHLRAQGGGRIVQMASIGGQIAFPAMSLYHATKWGIEGFWESANAELAPFGIDVMIVEPGVARTDFGGSSAALGPVLDDYAAGPSGALRDALAGRTSGPPAPGDPVKIVRAVINAATTPEVPRRLTLGSDAYALGVAALGERLEALRAARALAHSTDADDWARP